MFNPFVALVLSLSATLAVPASAGAVTWYPGEFAADIVFTNPENPKEQAQGTLHIGQGRFRAEGVHDGTRKALIVLSDKREAWTLLLDKGEYFPGMGGAPMPPKPDVELLPDDPKSPCTTEKSLSCSKVGTETMDGIQTDKWEIRVTRQGQIRALTLWSDPGRGIILRQQAEGGPAMVRKLLGVEEVGGRPTEKWEVSQTFQGKSRTHSRWVDVKLRLPVRMAGEQGVAMVVSNIREGAQPDRLFEIPASFKKVAPPAQALDLGNPPPGGDGGKPVPGRMTYH